MVARTEAELGPVTILVNNAGVAWQGTVDTYDREQVARMRQVNVEGMIHALTRTCATAKELIPAQPESPFTAVIAIEPLYDVIEKNEAALKGR
jgi:NAD(P)-dependent dehydrogenase (short-subunit alcohol dehydrogenase family)